jgi:hypothetical protein
LICGKTLISMALRPSVQDYSMLTRTTSYRNVFLSIAPHLGRGLGLAPRLPRQHLPTHLITHEALYRTIDRVEDRACGNGHLVTAHDTNAEERRHAFVVQEREMR